MRKNFYIRSLFLFSFSFAFAQQAPVYGTTTFNSITEYSDTSYENEMWAENVENTGWNFTASDAAGSFYLKKHVTGGCENYSDPWISVDHSALSNIKFKSNDASAFHFQAISVRPDAAADIRFYGYRDGVLVSGAVKAFRNTQPEMWAMYTFDEVSAFGAVDEIVIETSVPLHLLGFDNLVISAPVLSLTETEKSESVQCWLAHQTLFVVSEERFEAQLHTSDGRLVKMLNIEKGRTNIDLSALPKGLYFVTIPHQRISKKIRIE